MLLDTSVLIPLLRGEDAILQRVAQAERVYLCAPVAAELLVGLARLSNPVRQAARLQQIIEMLPVLGCDLGTAHHYAAVEAHLRRQGTPIPPNDVWIAAIALQHQLTLATRDAHFLRIPNLAVEVW